MPTLDSRFRRAALLHSDDFRSGLEQWHVELEAAGRVEAASGQLEIDVPAGATIWFRPLLQGPLLIEYEATAIAPGGPNDRVSDLNCFWMARDARSPDDLFGFRRSGQFADYNQLRAYYVGQGGNSNTTTRFRRYIGDRELRPLLPEHDLTDARHLLKPNQPRKLSLVACESLVQYFSDREKIFELQDPQPYTSGWFGLRTVTSHLRIRDFKIYRLEPVDPTT